MRDLKPAEIGSVYGAGGSGKKDYCKPKKHKYSKGSGSKGSHGKGSKGKGSSC